MADNRHISQNELEKYLWGAAVLLRGYIDASDYKQYIFPLLYFKRICDCYDEETEKAIEEVGEVFPEDHRFTVPEGSHWDDVRAVTENVGLSIQHAMRSIEEANREQLQGIFGDTTWTNKNFLSDATLRELIEHFSSQTLSIERVPQDELGQGYEYLIKKFADDSGHTAAEFYTNRTLVRLMTQMLKPKEGESIYDPTCGSAGMLLVAALQVKEEGGDYRTLKLYGQEINLITSSIGRMNMFLHGIDDFKIIRGDTLSNPAFVENDCLKTFDMVLANPPYSISKWNREAFSSDKWGRNMFGVPPQGRADYAFFQHIIKSMDPETGRCAILFPHGVLFRDAEKEMRKKLIEADLIECVLGLGPNLFYNSPMFSCVVICKTQKPKKRQGKVIFIDAQKEVTKSKTQSFIESHHRKRILNGYQRYEDIDGFSKVMKNEEILAQNGNLSVQMYVKPLNGNESEEEISLNELIAEWDEKCEDFGASIEDLISILKEVGMHE
ncbi:SAM-dependent DNA methyltransferase [Methanoplanus sp. FWC-SCC4]|uniref:site-specific DNA-methyltransferase (adenine-specific) n=1 Tax=Methanochimaera problematica TaxID=2609417 RepID=A0AA97FAX5_9EURY|nr:class I SAM-dependent DNA methyltransferase [Methanoplanus sp. FWC-SCC4]WOF16025.1 SAM-dependent DNA methyltransferase [Methanoplanus sp. FWC-SCC4]